MAPQINYQNGIRPDFWRNVDTEIKQDRLRNELRQVCHNHKFEELIEQIIMKYNLQNMIGSTHGTSLNADIILNRLF
jgi:hypothetical protein